MDTFEIQPGIGVGPVKLGMTRQAVRHALGMPRWTRKGREAYLDAFFVDFDDAGCVEFIELGKCERFEAVFDGICLLSVDAEEAVRVVSNFDTADDSVPDYGYSFIFLKLQMSLWRGIVPSADHPADDPDGRHFEAIGIGTKGYFKAGK